MKGNNPNSHTRIPKAFYAKPKHQAYLWFPENPTHASYLEQSLGEYALEGRILYNEASDTPWVFSIHGARADFTKSDAVSLGLQQRGYSLMGMSMSGHSKAGVLEPEQTTLGNNIREAEAFYDYLDDSRKGPSLHIVSAVRQH